MYDSIILFVLVLVGMVLILPITALVRASRAQSQAKLLREETERLENLVLWLEARVLQLEHQQSAVQGEPAAPAPIPPPHHEEVDRQLARRAGMARPLPVAKAPEVADPVPPSERPSERPPVAAVTAKGVPAPDLSPAKPLSRLVGVDWEQFMGAKLFAWIGGLALFLGIGFFLKYAFDRDLIPQEMRAALGFAAGIGLLAGGFRMDRRKYTITSHTLCATGILVLYATTFTCRSIYQFEFFGLIPTFLLMALITVTAFLLAVRLDAVVVAVLGIAGGFLTPVLLSAGYDHPLALFSYIALLDLGLFGVALHKRWNFLAALGAAGTVATQWNWYFDSFSADLAVTGLGIFLFFAALFAAAAYAGRKRDQSSDWFTYPAAALAGSLFAFAFACLGHWELAAAPATMLVAVFGGSLCLGALSLIRPERPEFHAAGAGLGFAVLAVWLAGPAGERADLLPWVLGASFVFALIHTSFPLVAERIGIGIIGPRQRWMHAFPLFSLLLILFPVAGIEGLSLFVWPVVFAITGMAAVSSVLARAPWLIAGALFLNILMLAVWIGNVPPVADSVTQLILVVGGFAVSIFGLTYLLRGRPGALGPADEIESGGKSEWEKPFDALTPHLPAASAALPFGLLILATLRLPVADPSPIFGLAIVLAGMLLGLAYLVPVHALPLVGLGCVVALQQVWQVEHLAGAVSGGVAMVPLLWHLAFFALFAGFPFLAWRRTRDSALPWIASALSGPLHFYLVHHLVGIAYPNEFMGMIPALFAIPSIAALVVLLKRLPPEAEARNSQLAWFGGVALFFITLIFPIQFSREWITIGWALEGAALLWLFHRIPHPGLRLTGLGLLAVSFVRLAINPAVLSYHPRGDMPILNWYLYTYGIGAACMFVGAWLLRPPRERVHDLDVPPILCGLGAVLMFLLVNIEIADFFTAAGERTLTFDFSGNLGRDMTYTIAWSLFALALVAIGLIRHIVFARYAGLGLLAVALMKLFFHDLANLEALYRIGALIGTAVIAIFASFLYQKLLSKEPKLDDHPPASSAP